MTQDQDNKSMELYHQFISSDFKAAIFTSSKECLNIGDIVEHEDKDVGTATITSFDVNTLTNDVIVHTDKGWVRLPYVRKVVQ